MRESVLRDFFSGKVTPSALAKDVAGSKRQVGPLEWVVEIEDMEGEFALTRQMLLSLCDAVLSSQFPAEDLVTVGFALAASDRFTWDGEDLLANVIYDLSCPEVNYPLTIENVRRFKNWLLELEPYPAKPASKPLTADEGLISTTKKKWLRPSKPR